MIFRIFPQKFACSVVILKPIGTDSQNPRTLRPEIYLNRQRHGLKLQADANFSSKWVHSEKCWCHHLKKWLTNLLLWRSKQILIGFWWNWRGGNLRKITQWRWYLMSLNYRNEIPKESLKKFLTPPPGQRSGEGGAKPNPGYIRTSFKTTVEGLPPSQPCFPGY